MPDRVWIRIDIVIERAPVLLLELPERLSGRQKLTVAFRQLRCDGPGLSRQGIKSQQSVDGSVSKSVVPLPNSTSVSGNAPWSCQIQQSMTPFRDGFVGIRTDDAFGTRTPGRRVRRAVFLLERISTATLSQAWTPSDSRASLRWRFRCGVLVRGAILRRKIPPSPHLRSTLHDSLTGARVVPSFLSVLSPQDHCSTRLTPVGLSRDRTQRGGGFQVPWR